MQPPYPSVRYLFSLLGSIRKESFGLHRMAWLMDELGNLERAPGIIHVAGTNGKGSTAVMIESGLRRAGYSTGLYTSPHLSRLNERFLLDGKAVSDDALETAAEKVRQANERVVARHGRGSHPTFFESITAVALVLFARNQVDFKIIETGLGGRLDASNVVSPEMVVITRVDHDHERYLGRGLRRIAAEKGAIVKRACLAIIGRQAPEARGVLLRCCSDASAEVRDVETEWQIRDALSERGRWRFTATGRKRSVCAELGLAGKHQIENALTAIAALDALDIPSEWVESGLREARWPGRLEFATGDPRVLLDAAHNPDGARALADFLGAEAGDREVTLIYGSSRDKAVDEIAGWMFPLANRVVLTRSRVQRSASPRALLAAVGHHHSRIETAPDIEEAMRIAGSSRDSRGWIVVAGSIFLVGEARDLLG